MISAVGVYKAFGQNLVLRGIDLTVNAKEVMCIVGPSGSGKSTFLRCINRLETIDAGSIRVGGELIGYREANGRLYDMKNRELAAQRQKTGMVFQSFNLFLHLTALENIMAAPLLVRKQSREQAKERALAVLERVGLSNHRDHYPSQLSGGQQQRVAIARALAMDPEVMLFDEPTSALDPELVGEVLDVIRDLADSGMTMVVVTHEMQFAQEVADEVVIMADGLVLERGKPKDVLTSPQHPRSRQFLTLSE